MTRHTLPNRPVDPAQLQPVIDAAIGDLKPREREAVLMRFFEHRELSDTDKGRKHVKEIHLVRVGNQWGLPIRKEVVEGTIQRLREDAK